MKTEGSVGLPARALENMRDCVRNALAKGCDRGHEFRKMRHAIIVELMRLGYESSEIKDILIEWNKRCEKPLGPADEKSQLLEYADWVDEESKLGCKALEDYCIGEETCQFHFRVTYKNRQTTIDLPFNRLDLQKFLSERFKADGYIMMLIVDALRHIQDHKATGEVVLVGFRTICSVIRDEYQHRLEPMVIFRKMKLLIEEGVIQQVVKGKSGQFNKQANGYRFLAWKHPQETHSPKAADTSTQNNSYV